VCVCACVCACVCVCVCALKYVCVYAYVLCVFKNPNNCHFFSGVPGLPEEKISGLETATHAATNTTTHTVTRF